MLRRVRLVVLVTVPALVVGAVQPVALPSGPAARPAGVLAAGSSGSIAHHAWWDPRGWFDGSPVPKSRQIAAGGLPSAGVPPRQAAAVPRRVRELTAQRNAFSRAYLLSDGRVQAEVSAVPVNYRDATGAWQPIDTTVRPSTAVAGYGYGDVSNTFRTFFGDAAGRLVRFEVPGGGWLAVGVDGGRAGRPEVAGNTVTYRDVAAGAALSYQVTPTALKESITLASAAAASSFSYTIRVGGGLVPWQRPEGSIAFSRDGVGGPPVLVLPRPFMTDSRAEASSPYGVSWSPKVGQRASWDAATGTLRVTVTADAGGCTRRAGRSRW